jgi:serine/threonine protein kinase
MRFKTEFEIKDLLGRGGNGSVWRSTNKLDKKDYAIKMAQYEEEIDPKVLREIIGRTSPMLGQRIGSRPIYSCSS